MCGIIGYTGPRKATEVLLSGLSRLEYRGYDSAGIAVIKGKKLQVTRKQGKLSVLIEELKHSPVGGHTGIGHTRWATHGAPNDTNAHPHTNHEKGITVVHNGIIENYSDLKKELIKKGYVFLSETDTEVIAHLIADNYDGDLLKAVRDTLRELEGSFAIAVMRREEEGRVVGARRDSPLIAGIGKGERFLASDVPAILEYTKEIIYLDNDEIINITPQGHSVHDKNGSPLKKKISRITWDITQAEKGGYKHFMLKEIFEQPDILRRLISKRVRKGRIFFEELSISPKDLAKIKDIAIVACGTAYHAGMVGKYILEKEVKVPAWVDQASEFRYRDPVIGKDTLVIVISQSGETADTLAGLREAKKKGATVLAVCNVLGSTIAREADGIIYTLAGPEIAVASTKAYTAQIATLFLFTYYLAAIKKVKGHNEKNFINEIKKIPEKAESFLNAYHTKKNVLGAYAAEFHNYYLSRNNKSCFLYLARNINYPNALEGALKLKEVSYISAEGYPAGEMKHGPIALIDENPWVVCIAVRAATYDKMISNIREIKARGGIVMTVMTEGDELAKDKSINYVIEVPDVREELSPLLVVLPLQLLAYYVAREFGYDIDKPRNLAKSVTVE
ncbi:MAG: glutamine--fructose-6-phosphate transaminase (isomerizing) [Candidatus Omnitrophica bacterium]|nr:glutamine--fructose-6-phosphate transaminase (isomerizing) [Candidatus Omnitrophota bacterium]